MNIRDLRYLVAVADTLHFGKAAELCFVSQPTLSMQIKKLEQTLGLQLLERANKRVLITEAGRVIVDRARQILTDVDDLLAWSKNHQDPLKGTLRMGVIPTLGPYLLPYIIKPLTQALPDLELLLREDLTENLMGKLAAGDLDVAVLALPIPDEGFSTREIFKEAFVLAVPKSHDLAKRKRVSVKDLIGDELLLLDEGHCLRDQALDVCANAQITEKYDFRATSLETLRQMVAAGSGITLLPELAVRDRAASNDYVNVSFQSPTPHRVIGTVWRQHSARTAAIDKLSEVIGKAMKSKITPKR